MPDRIVPSHSTPSQEDKVAIAKRLILEEIVQASDKKLLKLKDPVTGEMYFAKGASNNEISMTVKASKLDLGANPILQMPQLLTTNVSDLSTDLHIRAVGALSGNGILITKAVPPGNSMWDVKTRNVSGALKDQPITTEEFIQLAQELKQMNDAGVLHGDLYGNTEVKRAANGKLSIGVYDFEPERVKRLYPGTREDFAQVLGDAREIIGSGLVREELLGPLLRELPRKLNDPYGLSLEEQVRRQTSPVVIDEGINTRNKPLIERLVLTDEQPTNQDVVRTQDPTNGDIYYIKRAAPSEIEATQMAQEMRLPSDSPLKPVQLLYADREKVPDIFTRYFMQASAVDNRHGLMVVKSIPEKAPSLAALIIAPDLHSSWKEKPITGAEYGKVLDAAYLMNLQGVHHNDMIANSGVSRNSKGEFELNFFDFEPALSGPNRGTSEDHRRLVVSGYKMVAAGTLAKDALPILQRHLSISEVAEEHVARLNSAEARSIAQDIHRSGKVAPAPLPEPIDLNKPIEKLKSKIQAKHSAGELAVVPTTKGSTIAIIGPIEDLRETADLLMSAKPGVAFSREYTSDGRPMIRIKTADLDKMAEVLPSGVTLGKLERVYMTDRPAGWSQTPPQVSQPMAPATAASKKSGSTALAPLVDIFLRENSNDDLWYRSSVVMGRGMVDTTYFKGDALVPAQEALTALGYQEGVHFRIETNRRGETYLRPRFEAAEELNRHFDEAKAEAGRKRAAGITPAIFDNLGAGSPSSTDSQRGMVNINNMTPVQGELAIRHPLQRAVNNIDTENAKIAARLEIVEIINTERAAVIRLKDPVTQAEYYGKATTDAEIQMTQKAANVKLGPNAILQMPEVISTEASAVSRDIRAQFQGSNFLVVKAVPDGDTLEQLERKGPSQQYMQGKAITEDEFIQILGELYQLNRKEGVIHGDLPNNMNIRRDSNGILKIGAFDYEPDAFVPGEKRYAGKDDVIQMAAEAKYLFPRSSNRKILIGIQNAPSLNDESRVLIQERILFNGKLAEAEQTVNTLERILGEEGRSLTDSEAEQYREAKAVIYESQDVEAARDRRRNIERYQQIKDELPGQLLSKAEATIQSRANDFSVASDSLDIKTANYGLDVVPAGTLIIKDARNPNMAGATDADRALKAAIFELGGSVKFGLLEGKSVAYMVPTEGILHDADNVSIEKIKAIVSRSSANKNVSIQNAPRNTRFSTESLGANDMAGAERVSLLPESLAPTLNPIILGDSAAQAYEPIQIKIQPEQERIHPLNLPDIASNPSLPSAASTKNVMSRAKDFMFGKQRAGFGITGKISGLFGGIQSAINPNAMSSMVQLPMAGVQIADSGGGLAVDYLSSLASKTANVARSSGDMLAAEAAELRLLKLAKLSSISSVISGGIGVPLDVMNSVSAFKQGRPVEGVNNAAKVVSSGLFAAEGVSQTLQAFKFIAQSPAGHMSKMVKIAAPIAIVTTSVEIVTNSLEIKHTLADIDAINQEILAAQQKTYQPGALPDYLHYMKDNMGKKMYELPEPKLNEYKNLNLVQGMLSVAQKAEFEKFSNSPPAYVVEKVIDEEIARLQGSKERLTSDFSHSRPTVKGARDIGEVEIGLSDYEKAQTPQGRLQLAAENNAGMLTNLGGERMLAPAIRAREHAIETLENVDSKLRILNAAKLELRGDNEGVIKDKPYLLSYTARQGGIALAKEYVKDIDILEQKVGVFEKVIAQDVKAINALRQEYTKNFRDSLADKPGYSEEKTEALKLISKLEQQYQQDPSNKISKTSLLNAQAGLLEIEHANVQYVQQELATMIAKQQTLKAELKENIVLKITGMQTTADIPVNAILHPSAKASYASISDDKLTVSMDVSASPERLKMLQQEFQAMNMPMTVMGEKTADKNGRKAYTVGVFKGDLVGYLVRQLSNLKNDKLSFKLPSGALLTMEDSAKLFSNIIDSRTAADPHAAEATKQIRKIAELDKVELLYLNKQLAGAQLTELPIRVTAVNDSPISMLIGSVPNKSDLPIR